MSYNDGPRKRSKKPNPKPETKPVTAKILTDEQYRATLNLREQQLQSAKMIKQAPPQPPQLHPFASKVAISIERRRGEKEIALRDIITELSVMGGDAKAEGWYDIVKDIGSRDFGLREKVPGKFPTVWEMPQTLPLVAGGVVTQKAKYAKPLPGRILDDEIDLGRF